MPTVGELVAVLRADSAQFTASMEKAAAETESLKGSTTSFSKTASTAFIAAGAVAVIAIGKMIDSTVEWARQVKSLENTTGQTAESASALLVVGQQFGLTAQQMTTAFGIFEKNIVSGNKNIAKFGLVTRDAQGNLLPFDQQLQNAATTYAGLRTQTEKTAFAQLVFGRSGRALIPILKQGVGLTQAFADAMQSNLIMNQGQVDSAINLGIAERKLGESFHGIAVSIGTEFLPLATKLITWATEFVDWLGKIDPAIPAVVLGLTALVGAGAALIRVGQGVATAWGSLFGATSAEVTAQTAATDSTVTLTGALTELTAVLQAQAVAAGEADVALAGYGTTLSGLIVPEQALAASATETDTILGAGGGGGGLVATLGLINPVTVTAAAGIAIMGGELVALRRDARAASAEFQNGINKDVLALAGGGQAAARVRGLARMPQITTNPVAPAIMSGRGGGGPTAAILAQNRAIDIANQALAKYQEQQKLAAQSSDQMAHSIVGAVSSVHDLSTPLDSITGLTTMLDVGISKVSGAFDQFTQASGQDANTILANLQKVIDDPASTLEQAQQAYTTALDSMRAANQAWHDSIVSTFGGAGSALDKFANHQNVDLGAASTALTNYTKQIHSFDSDITTIQKRFGKGASDFVQWATSQGLAQTGLVHAVATGSKKETESFIHNWKQAQGATDQLASDIQKALAPVFNRIIGWLKNVVNAIQGVPPVSIKAQVHAEQLRTFDNNLQQLTSKTHYIDIVTHIHPGSPWPDEALKQHFTDPLKRNGGKFIGGRWTVPLDVSVHSSLQGDGNNPTAIVTHLARQAGWKGNVQNILDTVNTAGRDPHYIDQVTQKLADKLGPAAAKAFSAALTRLDTQAGGSDWWKASTWMDAATAHMPDLPSGHTHMFSQRHRPRHEQLRVVLDRRHYDEAQSFQEDYGRGY